MKEDKSIIKIIGTDDAVIGKCTLCKRNIVNDKEKFWCRETRMFNMKLFCGGCLIEMNTITTKVYKSFEKEHNKKLKEGTYYTIDEATGKLIVNNKGK